MNYKSLTQINENDPICFKLGEKIQKPSATYPPVVSWKPYVSEDVSVEGVEINTQTGQLRTNFKYPDNIEDNKANSVQVKDEWKEISRVNIGNGEYSILEVNEKTIIHRIRIKKLEPKLVEIKVLEGWKFSEDVGVVVNGSISSAKLGTLNVYSGPISSTENKLAEIPVSPSATGYILGTNGLLMGRDNSNNSDIPLWALELDPKFEIEGSGGWRTDNPGDRVGYYYATNLQRSPEAFKEIVEKKSFPFVRYWDGKSWSKGNSRKLPNSKGTLSIKWHPQPVSAEDMSLVGE